MAAQQDRALIPLIPPEREGAVFRGLGLALLFLAHRGVSQKGPGSVTRWCRSSSRWPCCVSGKRWRGLCRRRAVFNFLRVSSRGKGGDVSGIAFLRGSGDAASVCL